jgi:membrane AbrB-like protein
MATLAAKPRFRYTRIRFPQRRQTVTMATWAAVLAGCYLLSEWAETANLPTPQLLIALVAGSVLALTGAVTRTPPKSLTGASHAVIGALMGSYLDLGTLKSIGGIALPLVLVTVATVGIGVGVAFLLSRSKHLTLQDSTLGMVPGGSAAIIACAAEVGADSRVVAFAQYLRVGLVALTAPFLVLSLQGVAPPDHGPVTVGFPMLGHLVTAPDQVSRLVVLAAVCLLGSRLGRRLSLPAPVLLGSMLVATVAIGTHAADGFAPAGPLRDAVFMVVGLEVGLRFTWPSIRQLGKAAPYFVGAILLVCAACAALAWVLAATLGMSFLEAYLATTPGGINAVLAIADSAGVRVSVVSAVQSLRLFAVCLLVPPTIRWLTNRRSRSET